MCMNIKENPYVVPIQNQATGFASPAETEREPCLDLGKQLVAHPAATFLLRASTDWPEFGIRKGDLLVVDRAWEPHAGLLAMGVREGCFCLGRLQRAGRGWRLGKQVGFEEEIWGVVCHVIRRLV